MSDYKPTGMSTLAIFLLVHEKFPIEAILIVQHTLLTLPSSGISPFPLLADHATDVIAGSLLGLVTAYFSYRQYYPSLASPYSHRPYSPRIPRDDHLPMHAREVPLAVQHTGTDAETERELAAETVMRDEEGRVLWKDDDAAERAGLRDDMS